MNYNKYSPEVELSLLPRFYTKEIAIENGDVVLELSGTTNRERLLVFLDNVKNGIPNKINIAQFGVDGPPTTMILQYDSNIISLTSDVSRFSSSLQDYYTNYGYEIYSTIGKQYGLNYNQYFLISTDGRHIEMFNDIFSIG